LEITDFYAVKLVLADASISILGKTMPITIITGWEVAIRDCEFKNFTRIIRGESVSTTYSEQQGLYRFLPATGLSLVELVDFTDEDFSQVKATATQRVITDYDILFIDECSTVNNRDMRDIIAKATYKLLILVGDSYQIASIRFGNWFGVARAFIPDTAVFELMKPYRSNNESLLMLWDRVRKMEDTILELITRRGYSTALDASIFSPAEVDEIILCLNYDGLYGINNINRFLQESNPSSAVPWGIQQFKVNDPVLFNESDRFAPIIYNNMKGHIVGIDVLDVGIITERIQFDIELDKVINVVDELGQDFELLEYAVSGNSVIRFFVN
jgi:ATP-dependent exoDNAse (exonuclease V) alpha subunit